MAGKVVQCKSISSCNSISHVIIAKSYLLRPIKADQVGLLPILIMQNHAIRLCIMRYAKMVDLDRNQLRRRQKFCIMGYLHYDHLHY